MCQFWGTWERTGDLVRRGPVITGAIIQALQPAKAMPAPQPLPAVVIPQARERWMSARARSYTPEVIERTLAAALSGDLRCQWQLFDLMEDTWPRLAKNLNEVKEAAIALEWSVQPWAEKGKKPTSMAQQKADLVESLLWSMRSKPESDWNDFSATLRDTLDAWGKGIAVLEVDWEQGGYRGRQALSPRNTRWVHPRYYGYPANGTDLMLNTLEQGVQIPPEAPRVDYFAPFPEHKFIIAICKRKSGHPSVSAMLRPLAFWWCAANFGAEWLLNFAQIFGSPLRWATYDPNKPNLLNQILDMLDRMGSAGYAAFPEGTKLELKEAAKTAGDNPQGYLIALADKLCDLLVLGQTLTTDVGISGSRALGSVHQSVRADIIQSAAGFASASLQQLVRSICVLNFGDASECPYLMPQRKDVEDSVKMAERDKTLLDGGLTMGLAWLYDRHGIPMPAQGEPTIGGSAAAQPPMPGNKAAQPVQAKDATDLLAEQVMQDLTGVQAKWLGGVQPYFRRLVAAAMSDRVTDEDFIQALESSQAQMPELFDRLNTQELADALEASMGAAAANGAVQGFMSRGLGAKP